MSIKRSVFLSAALILGLSFSYSRARGQDSSKSTSVTGVMGKDAVQQEGQNDEDKQCREAATKVKAAAALCKDAKGAVHSDWTALSTCSNALKCKIDIAPADGDQSDDQKNAISDKAYQDNSSTYDKDDAKKERQESQDDAAKDINATAVGVTASDPNLKTCKDQKSQQMADDLNEEVKTNLEDKNKKANRVAELQKEILAAQKDATTEASAKAAEISRLTLDNQASDAKMRTLIQSQDTQAQMALDNIKTQQNQLAAKLLTLNGTEYQGDLLAFNTAIQKAMSDCRKTMSVLGAQNRLTNASLSQALGAASQGQGAFTNNFCNSSFDYTSAIQTANQNLALARTRIAEETTAIAVQQAAYTQQANRIVQNAKIQDTGTANDLAAKVTANNITIKNYTDQLQTSAAALKTNTDILNKQLADAQQDANKASKEYADTEGQLDTLQAAGIRPIKNDKQAEDYEKLRKDVDDGAKASLEIQNCSGYETDGTKKPVAH